MKKSILPVVLIVLTFAFGQKLNADTKAPANEAQKEFAKIFEEGCALAAEMYPDAEREGTPLCIRAHAIQDQWVKNGDARVNEPVAGLQFIELAAQELKIFPVQVPGIAERKAKYYEQESKRLAAELVKQNQTYETLRSFIYADKKVLASMEKEAASLQKKLEAEKIWGEKYRLAYQQLVARWNAQQACLAGTQTAEPSVNYIQNPYLNQRSGASLDDINNSLIINGANQQSQVDQLNYEINRLGRTVGR